MPLRKSSTLVATLLLPWAFGAVPAASAADGAHLINDGQATIEGVVRTGTDGSSSHARFTNDGTATATIVAVEVTGPDAADFSVDQGSLGKRIDPGETGSGFSFSFSFQTGGQKHATGTVTYDLDPADESDAFGTVTVEFSAFATRSPTGLVAVGGTQEVGAVPQDDWMPYTFSLRNRAEVPTTIVAFDDLATIRVRDDSGCAIGVTVEPDDTCILRVEISGDSDSQTGWNFHVRQAPPFRDLLVRFEGTVEPIHRDDRDPVVDPLAWPRPVGVAFGSRPRITVRQAVSARDRLPLRFTVDLQDLTAQTTRRLATRKSVDHVDVALAMGRPWRFAVTATDSSDNVSDEELGVAVRLSVVDLPVQPGWSSRDAAGFAKGGIVKTGVAGREIVMSVTGLTATLLARRAPTGGIVDIYVDGRLRRSVSLYASHTATAPTVFMPVVLGGGTHEVRMVTRESNGRHVFQLDALVVVR